METERDQPALRLWILDDGRAGHSMQALGLAEAVGRLRPVEIEERPFSLKPWVAALPASLADTIGSFFKQWPIAALASGEELLRWPWPDVLISTGRRSALVASALRRRHGITTLQILDPRLPVSAFDAVITPTHDDLSGSTVYNSVGALGRVTRDYIDAEARSWAEELGKIPTPRLAVLVGGTSGSAEFTGQDEHRLIMALHTLAESHTLLITTSRRTSEALRGKLAREFGDVAYLWTPEEGVDNPYPGLLGHVEAVLVTEDSVNMTSEAASSGLPVHVFPVSRLAPKLGRFHQSLTEYGASRRFTGSLQSWTSQPLAEADRIAADLVRRGVI